MKIYKKLVRDKIPSIIAARGDSAIIRTLSPEEFTVCLSAKLYEEVQEFLSDNSIEELADIYEVFLAILEDKGISFELLEQVRRKKLLERGNFSQKIYLDSVIEQEENRR